MKRYDSIDEELYRYDEESNPPDQFNDNSSITFSRGQYQSESRYPGPPTYYDQDDTGGCAYI